MSSPANRKPLSSSPSSRKGPYEGSSARASPSVAISSGQGLARNPSIRQSRLVRKSTNRVSNSLSPNDSEMEDEDMKTTNAQLIADLKDQVQRAEQAAAQYRKLLEVMQKRLDDTESEQTAAEERDFQRQTEIDHLRAEIRDSTRQRREMELSHESETRLLLQDRERQISKETELQAVIGRLNETLRAKSLEISSHSRQVSASIPQYNDDNLPRKGAEPAGDDYIRTIQEKDNAMEALRLELAEMHLKAAEQEHTGDGRLQGLEREILEVKMQNARLLEENESFQMLLSEKTLKGKFLSDHHAMEDISGMNTLAEELEYAGDEGEGESDAHKRLELENKTLKEGNKALTLYIDKIIGRLLQHDGFEHIILDKESGLEPPAKPALQDKALPATPVQAAAGQTVINNTPKTVSSAAAGFLQRARSVVARPNTTARARPVSYMPPPTATATTTSTAATANENPDTAPSIPLTRGHRRARSDQAQQDLGAAAVVQQMNRGSPLRAASGGLTLSPGLGPLSPQLNSGRQSYFPPTLPPTTTTAATTARTPPGTRGRPDSSGNSIGSGESVLAAEREPTDVNSSNNSSSGAPTSTANHPITTINNNTPTSLPGAVMKQNQLRPLRLVQEQSREDEEAQKRANRGSWMGWFKGSTLEAQNDGRL